MKRTFLLTILLILLSSCGAEKERWSCVEDGTVMYSLSSKGNIGGAQKGCSCNEMRNFEMKMFGTVDEDAFKNDFGC